jgi:hypothetical protein
VTLGVNVAPPQIVLTLSDEAVQEGRDEMILEYTEGK